jgi:hypothetical protein
MDGWMGGWMDGWMVRIFEQNTELALNVVVSILTTRLSVVEPYEVSNYENITAYSFSLLIRFTYLQFI